MALSSVELKNPTTILLISILLGWDRFFLGQTGLGLLKLLTCNGIMVWWLVDLFSVSDRTKTYNYQKLNMLL